MKSNSSSSNISRRSFVATAAVIPLSAATSSLSPTMTRLSAYMSEAGKLPLPEEALEKTKQHILDTFAAMVSGSELAPGRFAINFARAHSAEKTATVAASDVVCGAIEAAFSNAMLAHSDETDDSHAPSESHPGASIVPSALAAGEQFNIDGPRFLRAVALGYDVGTRVTMTVGVGGFQTATHISTHALAATFGSAAAAGCAAGLNERQMRWLIDYASQQASGIKTWQRDTDHIEKAFLFAGMPARNGVTAALLVQAGATGVDDVLSGQDNFLADYAPQADPGEAGREARRALRDHAHQYQEVDRRIADPGSARCAGRSFSRSVPSKPERGAKRWSCASPPAKRPW